MRATRATGNRTIVKGKAAARIKIAESADDPVAASPKLERKACEEGNARHEGEVNAGAQSDLVVVDSGRHAEPLHEWKQGQWQAVGPERTKEQAGRHGGQDQDIDAHYGEGSWPAVGLGTAPISQALKAREAEQSDESHEHQVADLERGEQRANQNLEDGSLAGGPFQEDLFDIRVQSRFAGEPRD